MEAWHEAPIRGLVEGRRVIFAGAVPAAWTDLHDIVRGLGASEVAVFAAEGSGAGTGPDCTTIVVEPPAGLDMMSMIRFGNAALADPPADAVAALDAFDPDRSAVVIGTFLAEAPTLGGRPLVHHRPPAWLALEDKTVVDAVWARAGVTAAPAATVPLAEAWPTACELDEGAGTVWAADATSGWHGGGTFTRWVTTEAERDDVLAALAPWCHDVRVMPFLDGIPCSIHGIVCADGIAALRPVEMVTLRRGHDFVYAGCATYWDPPVTVRDEMRDVARRVGALLADEVEYRGAFTVDGVVTRDGFRPTELNPRPGAGLVAIGRGLPDRFPLLLVIDLIAAGRDVGRTAAEIEHDLVTAADAARGGGTWCRSPTSPSRDLEGHRLQYVDGAWTDGDADDAAPAGTVLAGNGFVRCILDAARWPVGPSVAPAAAAFYRWCDDHLATGFGPLTPAPDELSA
jgi:hypothetical protein